MGFKFTYLCNLLSSLEDNRVLKATTQARSRNPDVRVVSEWFARHGKRLRESDTNQLALLSCMFPEKRTDRVYWLQDTNLARVIGRCLLLGSSRREELEKWRTSGGADLGQCVEDVMRQAENHIRADQEVTVEDIDEALNLIASRCRFSGPKVRRQRSAIDVEETLSPLYRRLSSRDAKWLTRMILKSHFSSIIPERLTLKNFHFLLPHLLLFQNSFEAAVGLLSSQPISHFPHQPEPGLAKDLGKIALYHLSPEIGIKIGRPDYYKARSIRHCCNMVGQRRMSVERKYDGEYCQVHIDFSKHPSSIQIFSKSGKDSTVDRAGVHQAVRESLRMGKEGCRFKRRCILEGELLVWSDKHQKIEHFHKLRKFVSRSGAFIGTESDSLPQPYEHLMIVFFDVLLLDDDICLRKPHRERRLLLKDTIKLIPGLADIAEQRIIDFSRSDGHSKLEALFSMGIAERWEGFVLKGCEDSYFPILIDPGDNCDGRWIKLKKDYIPGLGDTIDLALIGAAYNSRDASTLGLGKEVSWTHFFVGCLDNKDSVLQSNAKPRVHVLDVIDHHCMSQPNMRMLNNFGKYSARSVDSDHGLDIEHVRPGMPRIDIVFKTPFVVEMLGSGFEKPSGARYYTLRFPRILKIHSDRSIEDTASFRELQLLAEAAVSAPAEDVLEQEAEWAKRVKMSTSRPGYLQDRSQSLSTEPSPILSRMGPITAIESEQAEPICCSSLEALYQDGPTKRVSPQTETFAKTIPVYVDTRPTSSSSAGSPGPTGDVLASNENISQGNARKRKAVSPALEQHTKSIYQGSKKDDQSMGDNINPTLENTPVSACLGMAKKGRINDTNVGASDNTGQEVFGSVQSPLTRIPVFIHSEIVPKEQSTFNTFTNIAHTLEIFLLMLNQGDHESNMQQPTVTAASQHPLSGIVFIDYGQYPLGETLLHLIKRISQAFAVSPFNHYPHPKGRLFLLNSTFLQLDVNWKSNKLCLRKVWEKISRDYFYACIAWDKEARHGELINEVSSILLDDITSHAHRGSPGTISRRNGKYSPKYRISFDRKELLDLGEFSSLDPLVRV